MLCSVSAAATYHVDGVSKAASDGNAGTAESPWKTLSRAAAAKELKGGDEVIIHAGIYREHVQLKVSGQKGRPITFAAAAGERVVVKGSEVVKGPWSRLAGKADVKEPYPNAFVNVWRIRLGEEFFTDARFAGVYRDRSKRWVSQVFVNDNGSLQRIGLDPIYKNQPYVKLTTVGRGLADLIQDSFYFDASEQMLYVKMAGEPGWFSIEAGVRGFVLTAEDVHDVVIRGLEFRHNRQPGGQWSMVGLGRCQRVVMERCGIYRSDFAGLGMGQCVDCTISRCDLSYNGNTGLGMGQCRNCVIEDCTLLFNNTRRFHAGWHAGGMKCIPGNVGCTVRRCEAAYNITSDGIWFDADNADIRIVENVSHHNDGCGIFFEINKGGGIIGGNLVYANRGRGIYISGSQKTWIVHNTVARNGSGIVCMPRGEDWPLKDVHVRNNLLIHNTIAAENHARGADLTLFMGADSKPFKRTVTGNDSDHNIFARTSPPPTMRHSWNPDNTLAQWRSRFGEDIHSRLLPIQFEAMGTAFRLQTDKGLDAAGPLPAGLPWRPADPKRVGCKRTHWP